MVSQKLYCVLTIGMTKVIPLHFTFQQWHTGYKDAM